MRTINFNDDDIKQCKLALANQELTSLQSAFLAQYIVNIEYENKNLKSIIKEAREYIDRRDLEFGSDEHNHVLEILDKETI